MVPASGAVQSDRISFGSERPSESEIVDNYRLDHLYTYTFKDDAGKFFTVVSTDHDELPETVDARHATNTRTKIKTTLTFIRARGAIRDIEFKRFKFVRNDWAEHEGSIKFSFPFFVNLIGFLQGLAGLDLNTVSERRIPLGNSPSLDPETARKFQALAATAEGQELVAEVLRSGSITSADLVNIGYRKAQLEIFERMMAGSDAVKRYAATNDIRGGEERVWQCFFEANTWIFGYGLDFVFNQPLEGKRLEQTVHGHDLGGPGKRADGVLRTSGIVSSLCLVEIKTPSTALLEQTPYRSDCWQPTKELSGGIAQAQKTAQKTIENVAISPAYRSVDGVGNPTGETAYSYQPKSYLIVGSLSEFEMPFGINQERFASFELLRRQLNRPEIITFDELLARAKFIVSKT